MEVRTFGHSCSLSPSMKGIPVCNVYLEMNDVT